MSETNKNERIGYRGSLLKLAAEHLATVIHTSAHHDMGLMQGVDAASARKLRLSYSGFPREVTCRELPYGVYDLPGVHATVESFIMDNQGAWITGKITLKTPKHEIVLQKDDMNDLSICVDGSFIDHNDALDLELSRELDESKRTILEHSTELTVPERRTPEPDTGAAHTKLEHLLS